MITRRDFLKTTSTSIAAAGPLATLAAAPAEARSAELWIQRSVKPVVISDYSGWEFKNGLKEGLATSPCPTPTASSISTHRGFISDRASLLRSREPAQARVAE